MKTLVAACTSTGYPIKAYSDMYDSPVFAFMHEFGIFHVIQAQNEGNAYEIMLDESKTIDDDEVIEAYGYYILPNMEGDYTLIDDRHLGSIGKFATADEANRYALARIESDIDNHPLLEVYDYQPSMTGTGIVHTGHYINFASLKDCILIFESED